MNFKHGHARKGKVTAEWRVWYNMMSRCYRPSSSRYARYGGRGIRVCLRWHTFENFLADMGCVPDSLTLGRLDNNKSYSPNNCSWQTRSEQAINRKQHKLTKAKARRLKAALATARFGDKTKLARRFGISPSTISSILAGKAWAHV